MMTRPRVAQVVVLVGSLLALCAASWCATGVATLWQPHPQTDLIAQTVYAYRQWQSTGLYLNVGDRVDLTAQGQWSYSPEAGFHGPAGGRWAPSYYPLPTALGGALLGRVGETGDVFFVGPRAVFSPSQAGLLYLGINDDLLGDNSGVLAVKIKVVSPTPTPNP
jgi:hypothetical protein